LWLNKDVPITTKKFLRVGFVLLGGLTLLLGATYSHERRRTESLNHWVDHTYNAIIATQTLKDDIRDLEATDRAYALTGDARYLASFQKSVGEGDQDVAVVMQHFSVLAAEIADNPSQVQRMQALRELVVDKIAFARSIVALSKAGKTDEAARKLPNFHDADIMSKPFAIIEAIMDDERSLLAGRKNEDQDSKMRDAALTGAAFCLTMLVLLLSYIVIIRTLHKLLEAQSALRKVNRLHQAVLDGAGYAIIAMDTASQITLFNKAAEQMLGYTAEEVVGKEQAPLFHDSAEVAAWLDNMSKLAGSKMRADNVIGFIRDNPTVFTGEEREWTYVRKDGSRFPILMKLTVLHDDEGNVSGLLCISMDITERKEVEVMKNAFVSTVSHELRTPMTSIRSALELVMSGATGVIPAKAQSLVSIAYKNSDRLLRLINEILDIEKANAGKMRMDLRPVQLSPLIRQVVESNRAFAGQFRVQIAFDDTEPGVVVRADADRLAQVLTNFISNAVKFSPPGSDVMISETVEQGRIRVSVTDRGPGIPDSFRAHIFEKFSQAENADNRTGAGSGLGLSIAKSIVEQLEGDIGFDSAEGKGSTFYFELPLLPAQERATAEPFIMPAEGESCGRILVCEDDGDVAYMLQLMLGREGYTCDLAFTAGEAKAMLARNYYDAMTLDLILPDQSGVALMRELRSHPETAFLPIIVVSAKANEGRAELNGDAVEIIDWLVKPVDPKRLQRALQQIAGIAGQKQRPRVLYVPPDSSGAGMVRDALRAEADVVEAVSVKQAAELLSLTRYDVVIIDLNGTGDSMDLLTRLHAQGINAPPVIIFSSRVPTHDINQRMAETLTHPDAMENKILHLVRTLIHQKRARAA
jgi:signal transduction histidine kinase/DNA-binding response OmpR family regulator/CHASE3 domain sensor protein